MSKLSNQSKEEMIQCIEYLLKTGIYVYGTKMPHSLNNLASHLVTCGCRIHIGAKIRKQLNEEKINETNNTFN